MVGRDISRMVKFAGWDTCVFLNTCVCLYVHIRREGGEEIGNRIEPQVIDDSSSGGDRARARVKEVFILLTKSITKRGSCIKKG